MASGHSSSSDDLEAELIRIEAREAHYRREIARREAHETRQAQTQVVETQNTHSSDTYDSTHKLTVTDLCSIGAHIDQASGDEQWPHTIEDLSHDDDSGTKRQQLPELVDHGQHQGPATIPRAPIPTNSTPYLPVHEYEELQRQRGASARRAVSPSSIVEPFHPQTGPARSPSDDHNKTYKPCFSGRTPSHHSRGSDIEYPARNQESLDPWLDYGVLGAGPQPWSSYHLAYRIHEGTPSLPGESVAAVMCPTMASPTGSLSVYQFEGSHLLRNSNLCTGLSADWKSVRDRLPDTWRWDVDYNSIYAGSGGEQSGCWTCTPLQSNEPKDFPLTIASIPVVIPVEYRWPPGSGMVPPPDPLSEAPINCRLEMSLEQARDIFLTFEGSVGLYVLINGILQVIVPREFDTIWASSHLPHKYGGLKVCYIELSLDPTSSSSFTGAGGAEVPSASSGPCILESSMSPRRSVQLAQAVKQTASLRLNDFIEARPLSNHRKEKFSGRIGLQVAREGNSLITMSTHVITEAIIAKSHRDTLFGRRCRQRCQKLNNDWNDYTEIWADNEKIGIVHETFDKKADIYPNGFDSDVTLIKPISCTAVKDIVSPIPNLGWLNHDSWSSLRQQTSTVKILADTESHRSAKSISCSRPSDILVVGEGIFLNQKSAAGDLKSLKHHDASTWKDFVARAILYRVYPDFDPPNGHSGTALYAYGVREDSTYGPGIVGFQSFVQRSGHVQNFEMEGRPLEQRLQLGRVAFYGAFEVSAELKEYDIV